MLMKIRNGKIPLEDWLNYTEFALEKAREAEEKTKLPQEPDMDLINQLCMDIIRKYSFDDRNYW
jgi:hypothetical protein